MARYGSKIPLDNLKYGLVPFDNSTPGAPSSQYGIVLAYMTESKAWVYQVAFSTNGTVYKRRNINSAGWTEWEPL